MTLDIYNDVTAITGAIADLAVKRSRGVIAGWAYVHCEHFCAYVYDTSVWAYVPEKCGNSLTLCSRDPVEICLSLESVFIEPFDKWK